MIRRMVLWVMLLWSVPSLGQTAPAQVITGEDLARAGIYRLSDLFALALHWQGASTEGYHIDTAPVGISVPPADWMLVVDGQVVDLRTLGRTSLNALPVSMTEVCTVVLHSMPTSFDGVVAPGGAVAVQTCPVQPGVSVRGSMAVGNETGDPGPFQYTELGLANVDRTGPTANASASYVRAQWHVRAHAKLDEHHATDPRIRSRVHSLYRGEKDARILHRSLGADARYRQHTFAAASSRTEDLLYVEHLGREAPANYRFSYFQAVLRRRQMQLRLNLTRTDWFLRPNPDAVHADFGQVALRGNLRYSLSPQMELGARTQVLRTRLPWDQVLALNRVFARTALRPLVGIDANAQLGISIDGGALGYEFLADASRGKASAILVRRNRSTAAVHGLNYWLASGFAPGGRPALIPDGIGRRRLTSLDLARTGARTELALGYRHMIGPVRSMRARYDVRTTGLDAWSAVETVSGHVLRAAAEWRQSYGNGVGVGAGAVHAVPLSMHRAFRDTWHHRTRVFVRIDFAPNPRFSAQALIRYRGASDWYAYEAAAAAAPELYALRVPRGILADLTFSKRLWDEHLRLSASLRNLLDHPGLTHPAGGRTRLTFSMGILYEFATFEE